MGVQVGFGVSPWAMLTSFNLRERLALGRALLRLIWSPARTEEVFQLVEPFLRNDARQSGAIAAYIEAVLALPGVGACYQERYSPAPPDLATLAQLAPGALGRAFAEHMTARGLVVAFYPAVDVVSPMSWLEQRSRQQHDIVHVVTGFDTDLPGELGVQAFQLAQLNTPLAGALIGGGLLHAAIFHPEQLLPCLTAIATGFQLGERARPLLGYRFEAAWERPLEAVRQDLALVG